MKMTLEEQKLEPNEYKKRALEVEDGYLQLYDDPSGKKENHLPGKRWGFVYDFRKNKGTLMLYYFWNDSSYDVQKYRLLIPHEQIDYIWNLVLAINKFESAIDLIKSLHEAENFKVPNHDWSGKLRDCSIKHCYELRIEFLEAKLYEEKSYKKDYKKMMKIKDFLTGILLNLMLAALFGLFIYSITMILTI